VARCISGLGRAIALLFSLGWKPEELPSEELRPQELWLVPSSYLKPEVHPGQGKAR
jgi:hypothetical protein